MDEELILNGLKQSSIKSYEALIDEYSSYVVRVVKKVGGNLLLKEEIEEVSADVFIKCWEKRESMNVEDGKLKSYLGAMARNHTLNRLRSKGKYELIPLEEDTIDFSTPEHEVVQKEDEEILKELMDLLPEPDREIFIRRYFYMEKVLEIGSALGINAQTVATKLFRGKKKLERVLKERGVSYE